MSTRYFAYGSNLHPMRLGGRVGDVEPFAVAELRGWRLTFNKRSTDGSAKCHISPSSKDVDHVWGAVYELNQAQLEGLHRIEGVGLGYQVTHLELADRVHRNARVRDIGASSIRVVSGTGPGRRSFSWISSTVYRESCRRRDPNGSQDGRHRRLLG